MRAKFGGYHQNANLSSEGMIEMMRDPAKTIANLIDKQSTAFISYIDADGFPVTRAMLKPRERDGIKTFWFTTNTSSNKISCFEKNAKASIYFVDKRFFRGVCLCGTVEVLTDAESKERIWREGDTMYYPLGVTDPDYCVIKLNVEKGRYYSNFHSEDFSVE